MKRKEIKEMTSKERLDHAVELTEVYQKLFVYDALHGNDELSWLKEFRISYRITRNMMMMRGITPIGFYLRV